MMKSLIYRRCDMAEKIIFGNIEVKDNKMFCVPLIGTNIYGDIIPAALRYLEKLPYIDSIVINNLNYGASMELPRGTSMERAIEIFRTANNSAMDESDRKEKEFMATPEGQAKIKREQKEKEQEEKYAFKNTKEAFEALEEVKPLDLKSELTSMKQAVSFCKKIMVILSKCDRLHFDDDEQKLLSDLLKKKGACKSKDAHNKFKAVNKNLGKMINTPDSIEFPLLAFDQLIDASRSTFMTGIQKIAEGGEKYSWAMEWVNTQKATKEHAE